MFIEAIPSAAGSVVPEIVLHLAEESMRSGRRPRRAGALNVPAALVGLSLFGAASALARPFLDTATVAIAGPYSTGAGSGLGGDSPCTGGTALALAADVAPSRWDDELKPRPTACLRTPAPTAGCRPALRRDPGPRYVLERPLADRAIAFFKESPRAGAEVLVGTRAHDFPTERFRQVPSTQCVTRNREIWRSSNGRWRLA